MVLNFPDFFSNDVLKNKIQDNYLRNMNMKNVFRNHFFVSLNDNIGSFLSHERKSDKIKDSKQTC